MKVGLRSGTNHRAMPLDHRSINVKYHELPVLLTTESSGYRSMN